MASIREHPRGWRAFIFVGGQRASRLFATAVEAESWADAKETQLRRRLIQFKPPKITLLGLDVLRTLQPVTPQSMHSGVYFLWDEDSHLAYIGQSRNVAKRVERHKVEPPAPFQTATWLSIPDPWHLAIEQLYIAKYPPGVAQKRANSDSIASYAP